MQGLPPTGLQTQLNGLNQVYQNVQGATAMDPSSPGDTMTYGYNVRAQQFGQNQQSGALQLGQQQQQGVNGGSLDAMARNMAQRYGMSIGRGRLVDEAGNFLYTPKQLAEASGGTMTMGEAAANMNYISQALTKKQNEKQQALGLAAIQTGLGQVQQRGRGSLSSMMGGQYEAMADLYANKEYEAADFSYYIQKEFSDIQVELQRRYEKMAKDHARGKFWSGIVVTAIGMASGNNIMTGQGVAAITESAGSTGYF
tara:strand:- start:8003 stop:8767 length:765 start_codon:yes stop_codon:yes gene_type:complete